MKIYNDPKAFIPSYTFLKDWKKGDEAYYIDFSSENRFAIYHVIINNEQNYKENQVCFTIKKVIIATPKKYIEKEWAVSPGVWPTSFYYLDDSLFGTKYLTREALIHLFKIQ